MYTYIHTHNIVFSQYNVTFMFIFRADQLALDNQCALTEKAHLSDAFSSHGGLRHHRFLSV